MSRKKEIDFYKLGHDMAKGTKGTRWMAFNDGELKEALETEGENKNEKFENWSRGWTETEQWNYEVGDKIRSELGAHMTEENFEEWFDRENSWLRGYISYMLEKDKKSNRVLKEHKKIRKLKKVM